ncbi:hypothetical protein [Streptomyces sp. NPDC047130]|uniref:vWA domain-containing protein n=1 Tax=Streptomyces sp. NPDC047130 TaxID=3155261 RepID=UPI003401B6FC
MSLSLILNETAIPRGVVGTRRDLPPAFAVVYPVEGSGRFEVERERTRGQRWFGGNRPCFVVDLSDHRRQANVTRTPLTCRDGAHRFRASMDVGFRVHDPAALVQRNVRDALAVVYGWVTDVVRRTAARFPVEEARQAEYQVNQELNRDIALPEGITIFHCRVRMEADEAVEKHLRALSEETRRRQLGHTTHLTVVQQTEGEEEVRDLRDRAEARRMTERLSATANERMDIERLVRQHLARHPDDTATVLNLLTQLKAAESAQLQTASQQRQDLMRYLVEQQVLGKADLDGLRREALGVDTGAAAALDPGSPVAFSTAPPAVGSPDTPAPAAQQTSGASTGNAPVSAVSRTGVVPVYLVVDASPATSGCVTELENAIRSLQTVLSNSNEISEAVRLSVITYSDGADVILPQTRVSWTTGMPSLHASAGCRYRPVFRRLLDLVPQETERLKQQVPRVVRPVVFFLSVGGPEDDTEWPAVHTALMGHEFRPHIVACAIGEDRVRLAARIASRPELAVTAVEGADLGRSVVQFSVFVQQTVLNLVRGMLAGRMDMTLACPEGLTPVPVER